MSGSEKKETHAELRVQADAFPRKPGVYMFKDAAGRVLYVGKAKKLRTRARSYFAKNHPDPKIPMMLALSESVECVETPGEVDALLLESRLIKDFQPKYNRALKDGKTYPYVTIDRGTDFPSVGIVRGKDAKGVTYYGPFTNTTELRRAVRILQRIFKFRTCSMRITADDDRRRFHRPCLLYSVGQCSGPCGAKISTTDYKDALSRCRKVLLGRKKLVLRMLKKAMQQASAKLEYEKAAELRDELHALQSLMKKAAHGDFAEADTLAVDPREGTADLKEKLGMETLPRVVDGIDIATLAGGDSVGSIVRFIDGIPYRSGYRRFRIKTVEGVDDYAMMREVVARRFKRIDAGGEDAPDVLLIDGGRGHLSSVEGVLRNFKKRPAALAALAKREEKVFVSGMSEPLKLAKNTAALRLLMYVRDEAHRFAQHYHHLLRKKRVME